MTKCQLINVDQIFVSVTVAIVNCYSAKLAARVQLVFMLIKVFALVVIIVGGVIMLAQGKTHYLIAS